METDQKVLPPYVVFEFRAVEDREASIKEGVYVAKDVLFALITPRGSKDRVERVASEWLTHVESQAEQGRVPAEWPEMFRRKMEAFLRNEEIPEIGTPIKNWRGVSPAQIQVLLHAGITTVEALAALNEEGLHRLGLGGRGMKNLAVNWVKSQETGIPAAKLTALETENAALRERAKTLETSVEELTKRLDALTVKE